MLSWGIILATATLVSGRSKVYNELPEFEPSKAVLWQDPGQVETRNLRYGPGGSDLQPRAPFTFEKEDLSGGTPKVRVSDANGRTWVIKFGEEVLPDVFASRLAWTVGYYAEPNYYLDGQTVSGVHGLSRAERYIDEHGRAKGGRFQLRTNDPQYMAGYSWGWEENPFSGTAQLNGLRVLMMLVSNWDDKDMRDDHVGISTSVHSVTLWERPGTNNSIMRDSGRYMFFVDDWGSSLGQWGGFLGRSKRDCDGFLEESRHFVHGVRDGHVEFGFKAVHTRNLSKGIRVSDVSWLMQYLGRVTDEQLQAGLAASGATPKMTACYTKALRMRIRQLEQIANGQMVGAAPHRPYGN
jgi:hypothetical protein